MPPDPPLIRLREGRVSFGGAPVFDGVDVRVGRGERICLVGRNGSGKSTLMKALAHLIELDVGELYDAANYRPMVRHVRGKPMFLY